MKLIFEGVVGNDTVYMDCLKAICGNTSGKSMVDIGCNHAPHTPKLGFEKRTYIDILDRVLDHKDEQQYFIKADALEYLKVCPQVDVTLSLDNIEHFDVKGGGELLSLMYLNSRKQVIFTPLNAWMMDENGTDPEGHHSLWTPDMLPQYASIVFPNYHPTLGIGAWFGWHCDNIEEDFKRVCKELNQTV